MGIFISNDAAKIVTPVKLSLALPLAVIVFSFGYFVWLCIYNLYFHPLSKFPGPKLSAISRFPYSRLLISGEGHRDVLDLHLKYGPIVRIAPDFLSFSHPDAMNDIRGHRKAGQPEHRKDPIRQELHVTNIIGANRADHTRFRRSLANGFSHQAMLDQEPIIRDYVEELMKSLEKNGANGTQPIDMVRWFNYATFDIIGDLAFGESFGCLQSSTYDPWVQLIFNSVKNLVYIGALKHLKIVPKRLLKFILPYTMPKGVSNKYAENQRLSAMKVKKRLETGSNRPDFMTSMTAKRNGESLTFEELTSNASILIIAGSETTATALSAAAYYLGLFPEVQAKLAQEVRTTFNSAEDITITSVQHLTYMLAVLDEVMRMYPPVVSGLPRLTAEGGAMIAGEYVPEDTIVEVWQWPLFHNPNYWTQPDDFIPERWLGDPKFANDRRECFQPFSTGPRNCIGKNLAYSEMRLILARVIMQYDIKLAEGTEGWDDRSKTYSLWEKGPVNVYMIPRKVE
ncbi:cytochrome p450 domain-containing protein [Trichoderma breve]|uniref:Cytochrome p450 domain-containing protein n=1 Tax=Trichoderma breve TaxID=2034170 RepID=A0A9W9E3R1_9HYPO|nr:cytochrome p450 domain-containing protein [Trichoderma breve]KAJ4857898.1 cytochrome p450 domain-containing protein [Trichoderma breve]